VAKDHALVSLATSTLAVFDSSVVKKSTGARGVSWFIAPFSTAAVYDEITILSPQRRLFYGSVSPVGGTHAHWQISGVPV
jgi:hypothetical protein